MNELAIPRASGVLQRLSDQILTHTDNADAIEIVVRSSSTDLVARDMAAFLDVADHVYGRLDRAGLRSYARRESGHLRLAEVRNGSLELVILEIMKTAKEPWVLLAVWLCLKYLPAAAQSLSRAYRDYQEGALAKERRKRIRQDMEQSAELRGLARDDRAQLARLVEELLRRDSELLIRAARFSRRSILEISIRLTKQEKDEDIRSG